MARSSTTWRNSQTGNANGKPKRPRAAVDVLGIPRERLLLEEYKLKGARLLESLTGEELRAFEALLGCAGERVEQLPDAPDRVH